MGKTKRNEEYLAMNATINMGATKYRYLESFLTPKTRKYRVHMENTTPGISIPPDTAQVNIKGTNLNIKDAVQTLNLIKTLP